MRVLVIGSKGQLGSKVVELLNEDGRAQEVHAADLPELDVTQAPAVHAAVSALKPSWIVNCAAYNAVDDAVTQAKHLMKILKTIPDCGLL